MNDNDVIAVGFFVMKPNGGNTMSQVTNSLLSLLQSNNIKTSPNLDSKFGNVEPIDPTKPEGNDPAGNPTPKKTTCTSKEVYEAILAAGENGITIEGLRKLGNLTDAKDLSSKLTALYYVKKKISRRKSDDRFHNVYFVSAEQRKEAEDKNQEVVTN